MEKQIPKAVKLQNYGQVRTLADIAKLLNAKNHYSSPNDFYKDLRLHINDYMKRGTISDDAFESFKLMMDKNADIWFTDGHFDTDKMFAHLENEVDNDATTALDLIYERRAYAKLGYWVMLMNEIARYTDPQTLIDDIHKVSDQLNSDGFDRYFDWNDQLVIPNLQSSLIEYWQFMIDDGGHLDNDKLEEFMIGSHEKNVSNLGLDEVIRRYYTHDYCYTDIFHPMSNSIGPIYRVLEDGNYLRLCSAMGRRVFAPGKYELPVLKPVFERLCEGDEPEYIKYYNIYLPIRDFSRPVYNREGKVVFSNDAEKKLYLMQRLKDYKAEQKKDEQP